MTAVYGNKNKRRKIKMKEKKRLEALYNFGDLENDSCEASEEEDFDKAAELRRLTYKIEDNTAEIMNYNSIIETSKKSLKSAKKDYLKAKKEYDNKSFGALVFDIITFCCAFFTVYFLIKWLGDKNSQLFKALLYISLVATALAFLVALYKSFKVRPFKKRMKKAKGIMRDSKTWIEESERGMRLYEDENRALEKWRRGT